MLSLSSFRRSVSINPRIAHIEFAIRGPVEERAGEISNEIAKGKEYGFNRLIPCNIGNPYAVGKPVLTFPRQVLAAAEFPGIRFSKNIPEEAILRSSKFSAATMGSYSHLQGIPQIREDVAKFIQKRDGYPSDPNNIYLVHGATTGIMTVMQTILAGPQDGVFIPIPQYPLYTALTELYGATCIPYYLDESKGWAFNFDQIVASMRGLKGVVPKCFVAINPCNPTGSILKRADVHKIIDFCEAENILLIADEVYQENIYGKKFVSFKKEACIRHSKVQLVSLHSISKGFSGECGHRGGYIELFNISNEVREQIHKLFALHICPNIPGQILVDILVNPPHSHECRTLWNKETFREIKSLSLRAKKLSNAINNMPGLSTTKAEGAMYLYPKIEMPKKAIEAAKRVIINGKPAAPDLMWSLELLNQEGIIMSPGSGFGQAEGTHHFRTTFLPDEERLDDVIFRLDRFQNKFLERYS